MPRRTTRKAPRARVVCGERLERLSPLDYRSRDGWRFHYLEGQGWEIRHEDGRPRWYGGLMPLDDGLLHPVLLQCYLLPNLTAAVRMAQWARAYEHEAVARPPVQVDWSTVTID